MHKELLTAILIAIAVLLITRHHSIKQECSKPDCFGDPYWLNDQAERDCWSCPYSHECHRAPDEGWDNK